MMEIDFLIVFCFVWLIIGFLIVAGFYKLIDLIQAGYIRYFEQMDLLFQAQKVDRAEHRRSLGLIRDDLVSISGSVSEIRRIARSCENKEYR